MKLWLLAALTAAGPGALSLDDALGIAVAQSPAVRQAGYEASKANVVAEGARAEQLSYGASVNVLNYAGVPGLFGPIPPQFVYAPVANATLLARAPLFTGYKVTHQIAQADAGVQASRANADKVRQDLVWQVTDAYWQARRSELRAAVQADAVVKARGARDMVRTNSRIGTASANELDRVEVTLLNEESEHLRVQDEAAQTRNTLAGLLRRDLAGVALMDPPAPRDAVPPAVDDVLARARANRPDLRLAQAQLDQQQAAVGAAQGDRWPQIDLTTAYQHGNNPFNPTSQNRNVLTSFVGQWDARLNLSYSLLDNGLIARTIDARALEAQAAQAGLEATERQAEVEVRQALGRLDLARRRLAIGERSVALATKNLKWLEGRFKFGYAVVTELNEARQTLKVASNQRIDALIDYQLAGAALDRATGSLRAPEAGQERPR